MLKRLWEFVEVVVFKRKLCPLCEGHGWVATAGVGLEGMHETQKATCHRCGGYGRVLRTRKTDN